MDLMLSNQVAIVTGRQPRHRPGDRRDPVGRGNEVVLVARSQPDLETVAASLSTESLVQAVDLRKLEIGRAGGC